MVQECRLTAKLSFLASLNVKASVGVQSAETQNFTSKVEETVSINVGGQPPLTGNWLDWQQALKYAPAPISYTLVDIPVLFTSWNFPELTPLQLYIMTDSYLNFLQFSYCNVVNCSPPGIDPALPSKFSRYPVLWYNNIAVGCVFGDTKNRFGWRNYGQVITISLKKLSAKSPRPFTKCSSQTRTIPLLQIYV